MAFRMPFDRKGVAVARERLLVKFSGLGDPTLLLLAGLGVFFYLWSDDGRRRLARSWAVALGICIVLTLTSKFAFLLLAGNHPNSHALRSPSGHVAIATGFYGCCALLLASGRSQVTGFLLWGGTVVLVGMLAASRVLLGLHTGLEIVVGFAIGAFSLAIFALHLVGQARIVLNAGHVIALVLLIGVAHSSRIDGEPLIKHLVKKVDFLRGAEASGEAQERPDPAG